MVVTAGANSGRMPQLLVFRSAMAAGVPMRAKPIAGASDPEDRVRAFVHLPRTLRDR